MGVCFGGMGRGGFRGFEMIFVFWVCVLGEGESEWRVCEGGG